MLKDTIKQELQTKDSQIDFLQQKIIVMKSELQQLKEDNRRFEDKIQNSYQKIGKLRQLLKKTRNILYDYKDYFQSGDVVKAMDILDGINAVIGESEE